jgi:ligand-binding sensor domain-containing protein
LLLSDFVAAVAADLSNATIDGEMWIVTGGLNRVILNSTNGGTWIDYQSPQIPSNQNTVAVTSPLDYSIWIGSVSNGMEMVTYTPNFAISNIPIPSGYVGKITGIAFDGNHNVWMSKDIGVSAVNLLSNNWIHYKSADTSGHLPRGNVNAVASDLGPNRWFGTDSGLVHLVDTTWSRFTTANSPLPNDTVTSLSYDTRGNLWIGTRNGAAAYRPEGTRF